MGVVQLKVEGQQPEAQMINVAVYQDKPGLCLHFDKRGKELIERHFGAISVNPKKEAFERFRQEGIRLGVEVVGPQELLVFKDQKGVGLFLKLKYQADPVWAWQRAASLIKNYRKLATQGMSPIESVQAEPDGSLRIRMTKTPVGVRSQDRPIKGVKRKPVTAAKAARQARLTPAAPKPTAKPRMASDIVARVVIDVYGNKELIDRELNLFQWLYIKKQLDL